jgi:hypothetical protein
LVSASAFFINDYSKSGNIFYLAGGRPEMGDINNLRNFAVNTSLPKDPRSMKIYAIRNPTFTQESCSNLVDRDYPGWLDDSVTVKESSGEHGGETVRGTSFKKDERQILVHDSGSLQLMEESATFRWESVKNRMRAANQSFRGEQNMTFEDTLLVSKDEALNRSIDYALDHGGLPADWFVSSRAVSVEMGMGCTFACDYLIYLDRKVDGYPVVGSGGEGAMVGMTPLGEVSNYIVLWRDISGVKRTAHIVSSETALAYLDRHPAHCTMHGKVTIERIELGYYSAPFDNVQTEMNPVWVFYTNPQCTQYEFVDALGLRFSRA